jgi:hypothetical protein
MRGQAAVVASASTVIIVAVLILVGSVVFGYFMQATPHDLPYYNESMCTTCSELTLYELDHYYVNNDTRLTCSNATGELALANGVTLNASTGFNLVEQRYINLTTLPRSNQSYSNVKCDYFQDTATNDQESFWSNASQNSLAGFAIISVIIIVLVAVSIIGIIVLLKG